LTLIFSSFIRDDPPHPCHPRSIDTSFTVERRSGAPGDGYLREPRSLPLAVLIRRSI